jgi:hypothetical protein
MALFKSDFCYPPKQRKEGGIKRKDWQVVVSIAVVVLIVWQLGAMVIHSISKKEIEEATGFKWAKGTKALQWQYGGLQSDWVKVHLQLPYPVQLNTNQYSRFDFAYCKEFDPQTMNIWRWEKQRRIWRFQKDIFWFDDMKKRPIAGTNLLFAVSKSFESVTWAIVYDEQSKQMWIHCF